MDDEVTTKKLETVREMVWRADASTDANARMQRLIRLFDQAYKAVSQTMSTSEKGTPPPSP